MNVPSYRRILAMTVLTLTLIAPRFASPVAAQTPAERTESLGRLRSSLLFHASF
jgi:hypothetical protein